MSDQEVPHLAEYHPELQQESHQQPQHSNGFLTGAVNVFGFRVPNLILIIVVLALAYLLYAHYNKTEHSLAPLVGGALDSSASPGSGSFLRDLHIE
jgi:hypothetical protein